MALCLFIVNSVYYANKLGYEKKVRHKIHDIFHNEAENKI